MGIQVECNDDLLAVLLFDQISRLRHLLEAYPDLLSRVLLRVEGRSEE